MSEGRAPSTSSLLVALIADTFQEARARWLFWGLFGLSTLLIAFFLFVLRIDVVQGAVSLLGIDRTSHHYYSLDRVVRFAYSKVAMFLYVWETFLAIFASAGLTPSILEPGRVGLLLSKPVSRPVLLLGRFIGNTLIITANVTYLIFSVWIIVGLKTGLWYPQFLITIPITVLIFTVLLCVVVLIGIAFESASVAVMVTFAIILMSAVLAQRDIFVKLLDAEWARQLWLALYWIFPKVWDLGRTISDLISNRQAEWFRAAWTSALFGVAVLGAAIQVFRKRDY
jgi:ABC-type transport system involved in multi-copper enzyme maturation permease subunit